MLSLTAAGKEQKYSVTKKPATVSKSQRLRKKFFNFTINIHHFYKNPYILHNLACIFKNIK